MNDDITKRAANNKQIDIILLDFSKAFDKVPHKRLLNKLIYYVIRSNTLQWIYSFLHDRKQLVHLEGVKSSTATKKNILIPNVAEKNILILLEEKKIRALRDKKKIF